MDNKINKMLIAVDGSEAAAKGLDFTLNLADKLDAEVQILSVVPPVDSIIPRFIPMAPPSTFYTSIIDEMEKRLKTVLSEALKSAKEKTPKLKISTRLLKGRPADRIIQTAKEEGFDIIVVGSRGLSGVEEFFLGSVSDRIADRASCSVLIVK